MEEVTQTSQPQNNQGEQNRSEDKSENKSEQTGNENKSGQNRSRNRNRPGGQNRNRQNRTEEGGTVQESNRDNTASKGSANRSNQNRSGGGNRGRRRNAPAPTDQVLLECVRANHEIQKERLNPHYKLDLNNNAKVRITPLGGLGEIGGNIAVIETDKEAILIDVGMSFPDEDMHGVDILVPDFSYIREIQKKDCRDYHYPCARGSYRCGTVSV